MLWVEKNYSTCTSVWLFLYSFLTNIYLLLSFHHFTSINHHMYHFINHHFTIITSTPHILQPLFQIIILPILPSLHQLHSQSTILQPSFCHHSTPSIIIWPSLHSNPSPFYDFYHHHVIISSSLQSKISSILNRKIHFMFSS